MHITSLSPNLMVDDVAETVAWYEETFDAEVVAQLPRDDATAPWWAQVAIDDVSLMFQERDNLREKLPAVEGMSVGASMPLFLRVNDVQILHDSLSSAGLEFEMDLHETDAGWFQFAVRDPNGYILWFGEHILPEKLGPIVR